MSEPKAETENSQPPERTGSPPTDVPPVADDEPAAAPAKADKVEKPRGELAAALAVNGLDEPRRTSTKLDMPSLELSDNEFNSTDSDSFAGRAQKNRTLELKLSAIIEKACSSDFEVEDLQAAQPSPASNVTVTLPNSQLLFTVEGVSVSAAVGEQSTPQPAAKKAPTRRKKYVYKLKSKGGTVLTYTSYTPVVLKKPRINLTRVEVGAIRAKRKAPSRGAPANGKRGRGQPPRAPAPPAAPVDEAPADEANSSFGMRTRKRKLKFRPDGRLECVAKRRRSSSSSISDARDSPPPKESTDEDWEATGDDLRELNTRSEATAARPAKRKPATKAPTRSAKVAAPKSDRRESPQPAKAETSKTSVANNAAAGRALSAAKPSVNPAQLLSTLLGVTIRPSQLNTVRFKPKSYQKQHATLQKTIVMSSDELKKAASHLDKAITPKPLMQKILPKSSLTSIFNKTVTPSPPSTPSMLSMALSGDLVSPTAAACAEPAEAPPEVPNFDHFTDSRTVRTKGGPKKWLLQNLPGLGDDGQKLNRLTVYDLAQNVFDRMPTWNLHVMPDTNTFCIAQVGRGRMGIPILKKSVELNDNFAAKIFVHQLHCKKFDGVYDTEAKIDSLIAEINSLAA